MNARTETDVDLVAEHACVGGLLNYSDQAALVIAEHNLGAAHFTDAAMRAAFGAICALLEEGKQVDALAVFDELRARGLAPDMAAITSATHHAVSVRSLHTAAQMVEKAHARRELLAALRQATEQAQSAADPAEAIDQVQSLLAKLQAGVGRAEPRSARELLAARASHYEALLRGEHPVDDAMPTHIPALDHALNGGLQRGRLYILAARPSVGKSSFALDLALRVSADGHPALFLSLEMPASEVVDRCVASLGGCGYSTLQTGQGARDDDWSALVSGMDALSERPLFIDDQGALTMPAIRAKAYAVHLRGLRLLVVDYLQLARGAGEERRDLELSAITGGLKALAKELDIAVILLSQLNREVERRPGGRPQLSDLRDSGGIEQDADTVMFLWRAGTDDEAEIGLAIDKNRSGRRAQIAMTFDGDHQRWAQSTRSLADLLPARRPASRVFD